MAVNAWEGIKKDQGSGMGIYLQHLYILILMRGLES